MTKTIMSSVDRALTLLQYFSIHKSEFGLTELSRLAGYDKTTTLRCLASLERNGFIEQDPLTRKYRLGLAPITLARVREQSFPLQSLIQPHLDRLVADTGETAHATLVSGNRLLTALTSEPDRALRVFVDPAGHLPVHATASGIVIAAFSSDDIRRQMLATDGLKAYTQATPTTQAKLKKYFELARENGFARSEHTFEEEVIGTASAIFGPAGVPVGAIAVAAVASRFDTARKSSIEVGVREASIATTLALGGVFPMPSSSEHIT